MSLSSKHPAFDRYLEDWLLCEHSYAGERVVKDMGMIYLPATSGMIQDGARTVNSPGWHAYQAYKTRAIFHEFFAEAVETYMGMMWHKPPVIELPEALEPMRARATANGETLEQLLRRVNERQLVTGRCGLFADFPAKPTTAQVTPYLALYETRHIINWDLTGRDELGTERLTLVVLDETEEQRTAEFSWERKEKYRVLALGDITPTDDVEPVLAYKAGLMTSTTYVPASMIEPTYRGKKLEEIPFVFINSKDNLDRPDDPPLTGLANLCMAIYRGEADYRQALFMQGQDTLVVIGGAKDTTYRIGAGSVINLTKDADAKFIGCNSEGLPEMREALENDKQLASQKAGKLADMKSAQRSSGDALKTRLGAQTATLNQIALAGAAGLESLLKICARWVGANPDEVKVTPNLEFETVPMTGTDLSQLISAKTMGAPLSMETIHAQMVARNLTKKTLEEELEAIENEEPLIPGGPGTVTDPDDPDYDKNKDPNYNPEADPDSSRFKDPDEEADRQIKIKTAKPPFEKKPPAKK